MRYAIVGSFDGINEERAGEFPTLVDAQKAFNRYTPNEIRAFGISICPLIGGRFSRY